MQLTRMAGLHCTLLHFMEDLDVFNCFFVGADMPMMLKTQVAVQVRRFVN